MKACVVTEAFITSGSNGMQGTRGKVTATQTTQGELER